MLELDDTYGIKERLVDQEALLFSIHTYFALIMKLLAAEVAVSLEGNVKAFNEIISG